ncbi:MAG: hypothetical protein ABJB74_10800, partial [Gemmatimonas sp.]
MKRIMLLSVVGCAFLARVGTAQEVQPTNLKPADAVLTLPFRSAASVRELRDGRVIFEMAGRTGAYAAIADMKSGRMDSIPGFPLDAVFPLAADTSLIRASGGWVFAKGITVLGMLEATNPVVVAARNLTGVDSLGFVVALRNYGADSSDVLRVNRSTAEVEQLVRIQRFPGVRGGVPAPYYQNREHVIYTLDGWLGVLRIAPYRVDWRSPAGTWTLGKPIPVP